MFQTWQTGVELGRCGAEIGCSGVWLMMEGVVPEQTPGHHGDSKSGGDGLFGGKGCSTSQPAA